MAVFWRLGSASPAPGGAQNSKKKKKRHTIKHTHTAHTHVLFFFLLFLFLPYPFSLNFFQLSPLQNPSFSQNQPHPLHLLPFSSIPPSSSSILLQSFKVKTLLFSSLLLLLSFIFVFFSFHLMLENACGFGVCGCM